MTALLTQAEEKGPDPMEVPQGAELAQANGQLYYAPVMLVKGAATKKAKSSPVGRGAEVWGLLAYEYEQTQRRRSQAMLSAVLRFKLPGSLSESIDGFERMVKQYSDQLGREAPDEFLAATVLSGIENAAIIQHLALNDATLDTCLKIAKSLRAYISVSRTRQTTDLGAPMDVDAISHREGD